MDSVLPNFDFFRAFKIPHNVPWRRKCKCLVYVWQSKKICKWNMFSCCVNYSCILACDSLSFSETCCQAKFGKHYDTRVCTLLRRHEFMTYFTFFISYQLSFIYKKVPFVVWLKSMLSFLLSVSLSPLSKLFYKMATVHLC